MRITHLWVLTALTLAICSSNGYAVEYKSNTLLFGTTLDWLRINKNAEFKVIINDQVTDSCWTNATAVKTAVELELKRSGFKLSSEKNAFPFRIYLTTLGFEKAKICMVSMRMELWGFTSLDTFVKNDHKITSFLNYKFYWSRDGIVSGGKGNMSSWIKEDYIEYIQNLLVFIDKRKTAILEEVVKEAEKDAAAKAFWSKYKSD